LLGRARGYTPDAALVRLRGPKLPQGELEAYTEAQMAKVLEAASPAWGRLAVLMLLGTGMRVGELSALTVDDFEDEAEAAFLKVRHGKGGKFRRIPVSQRLRREIQRYLNRHRPETATENLVVLRDGRPIAPESCARLFQRVSQRVGFRVHAHKFRHTFATEYLRNGGELERLRRILGHSTYVMVMRYVHLDKGDLMKDFDIRTPY
jgi:integrase